MSTAYALGTTKCYQITTAAADGYMNPCPAPYYGIFPSKLCVPCPTGCAKCNIYLPSEMPGSTFSASVYSWSPDCNGDGLCTFALHCETCSASYNMAAGKCFPTSTCLSYAVYNSNASGFNPAYCNCKTGFYISGTTFCSICHYTCETCTGPASTNCASCILGHVLDTGTGKCDTYNDTYKVLKDENGAQSNGTLSFVVAGSTGSAATTGGCPVSTYRVGYYGYANSSGTYTSKFGTATATYTITLAQIAAVSTNHYGFHFKATMLFIDEWLDGIQVSFYANNEGVHTYTYDMEEVVG